MLENPKCLAQIRKYNSAFSFISFSVSQDDILMKNNVYTLRIHGQIHHYIGPLIPGQDVQPTCAQIYFKGEDEVKMRQEFSEGLNGLVLIQIQALLFEINPFIKQFKKAASIYKGI